MPEEAIKLDSLLQGCRRGDRNSQRKLYEHFYGYALNICYRYSKSREEAVEIMNDAFLKVFTRLDRYDPAYPFKTWLRRILINSAIDYYRKHHNSPVHVQLEAAAETTADEMPMPKISPDEDLLPVLRKLSPAYRIVFNLYVLEGYKHTEIAELLGISVGTSQSNLVRATARIRALLTAAKNFDPIKMN